MIIKSTPDKFHNIIFSIKLKCLFVIKWEKALDEHFTVNVKSTQSLRADDRNSNEHFTVQNSTLLKTTGIENSSKGFSYDLRILKLEIAY